MHMGNKGYPIWSELWWLWVKCVTTVHCTLFLWAHIAAYDDPLSTFGSTYNGHMSIRTGWWSSGTRLADQMSHILFYITWSAFYVCAIFLGKWWQHDGLWDHDKPVEQVWCWETLGPAINTIPTEIITDQVRPFMAVVFPGGSDLFQQDNPHCAHGSGMVWGTRRIVQDVALVSKFPRFQSDWVYLGCAGPTNSIHSGSCNLQALNDLLLIYWWYHRTDSEVSALFWQHVEDQQHIRQVGITFCIFCVCVYNRGQ